MIEKRLPLPDDVAAVEPAVAAGAAPPSATLALWGIFLLLLGFALYSMRSVGLPVAIAALASLVLAPAVRALRRVRVPPPLGAGLLLVALFGVVAYGMVALSTPAAEWVKRAPESARQIERKLRFLREPVAAVNAATEKVAEATQVPSTEPAQTVVVQPPGTVDILLGQTWDALVALLMTAFLLYALLASPDDFLEGVVSLAPRLRDKKRIVAAAREIERQMSRYLVTISVINLVFGAAVFAAMLALEVPNAALWGVLAALTNFVPYVGAFAMALVLTGVGVLSFDEPLRMLAPALTFVALNVIEANAVTPMILGHRFTLRPAVVFVWVLLWSWLWGIPGGLVAVPLLTTTKIALAHVPSLAPVARLLG